MAEPPANSPAKRLALSLLGLLLPVVAALGIGVFGLFMMAMVSGGPAAEGNSAVEHSHELYYLAMFGIASSGLLFGFAFVSPQPIRWMIQSGVIIASMSVLFGAGTVFHYLFTAVT